MGDAQHTCIHTRTLHSHYKQLFFAVLNFKIFIFSGKAFSITYIRLKFQSSRPESFAIYKKTSEDGDWIPYQYYSASCEETYNRQTRDIITRDDETKPICTDEYSDISPLTGGSVAFSTLEGRPSAYNFENSPVLQVSCPWINS